MRAVLVAHPSPDLYGSDRMLLESVEGLCAAGWRVVVTLPGPGPLLAELAARGVETAVVDVPVLRRSLLSPVGLLRFAAATLRCLPPVLRLLRRVRPDVVYVNTVTIPGWLLVARASGRPVLAHVHEAEKHLPAVVRIALAAPLLFASAVVANSRATAEVLVGAVPALRRRTRVVYNGVPGPDAGPVRRTPSAAARLLVVGRLSRRKGCHVAVDAVARLRAAGADVRLDFVGAVFPGYEPYQDELHARIADLGLTDVVRLRGFQASVWAAYADADIAVMPSFGESFGNAAVEAQLAGRPVVVSGVQGLLEIVESGRTGLVVPPDDPAALAGALRVLLEDPAYAAALAVAGQEAARRRFDPARYRAEIAAAVAALAR